MGRALDVRLVILGNKLGTTERFAEQPWWPGGGGSGTSSCGYMIIFFPTIASLSLCWDTAGKMVRLILGLVRAGTEN